MYIISTDENQKKKINNKTFLDNFGNTSKLHEKMIDNFKKLTEMKAILRLSVDHNNLMRIR